MLALAQDVVALGSLARKLCGNQPDADDLVQDTIERALRAAPDYAETGKRLAWLATILRNRFIDARRTSRAITSDDVDQLPAPEPEPVHVAGWDHLTHEDVAGAVAQLEEPFRRVYELHVEGMSYVQIARELGIPTSTVGTRLVRARHKLKEMLTR